jgi:Fic family protein
VSPTSQQKEQPLAAPTPLGHFEERIWAPDPGAYGGRRSRRGGPYRVFVPDPIAKRAFELGGEAVAAVTAATKALAHLNGGSPRLASLNALASNLLRSESAASSRIEGLAVSHRRLARAAYQGPGKPGGDTRAAEVLGNVEALKRAIELGADAEPFGVPGIEDVHRSLLRFTQNREIAGVVRTAQNWIGGNDFNPLGATYVPPPPEHVRALLKDLCTFIERDDLAPIAQAAIAHAQFENIHPFADGNGRVGRALIYTVLRRRGEVAVYIPPISLVLATEPKAYIGGLGAYSTGDVSHWCEIFSAATERAALEAERLAQAIEERQAAWLDRLGSPRQDSAVRQLIGALPGQPVIDVAAGQQLTGKSHVAVQRALQQLEDAGILQRLNERKWGRVWECGELPDLVEELEESIGTP